MGDKIVDRISAIAKLKDGALIDALREIKQGIMSDPKLDNDFARANRLVYIRRLCSQAGIDPEIIKSSLRDRELTTSRNRIGEKRAQERIESTKNRVAPAGFELQTIVRGISDAVKSGYKHYVGDARFRRDDRNRLILWVLTAGCMRPSEYMRLRIFNDRESGQWFCDHISKAPPTEKRPFQALVNMNEFEDALDMTREWIETGYADTPADQAYAFQRDTRAGSERYTIKDLRSLGCSYAMLLAREKDAVSEGSIINTARRALRHKSDVSACERYMTVAVSGQSSDDSHDRELSSDDEIAVATPEPRVIEKPKSRRDARGRFVKQTRAESTQKPTMRRAEPVATDICAAAPPEPRGRRAIKKPRRYGFD